MWVYIAVLSTPDRKHCILACLVKRDTLPVLETRQVMRTLDRTRQVAGLIILHIRERDDRTACRLPLAYSLHYTVTAFCCHHCYA